MFDMKVPVPKGTDGKKATRIRHRGKSALRTEFESLRDDYEREKSQRRELSEVTESDLSTSLRNKVDGAAALRYHEYSDGAGKAEMNCPSGDYDITLRVAGGTVDIMVDGEKKYKIVAGDALKRYEFTVSLTSGSHVIDAVRSEAVIVSDFSVKGDFDGWLRYMEQRISAL